MRPRKEGIIIAIELRVANGRVARKNTNIRSIIAICYGLQSAEVTLALVTRSLGPIDLKLPDGKREPST